MEEMLSVESQRARALADEYRSKGYEVTEQPSPEQLPDFLARYHPGLLIRKGDETIVVEVKSRAALAKDPEIRELAQLLHAKPHWKLELVVVGDEERLEAPEGAHPFERDDIPRRLEAAERLLELGFAEAALMLAWSTAEAAVRLLMEEEGILASRPDSLHLLKEAVMNGVISRNDYTLLMDVMKYRNALAHGFKAPDFQPSRVTDLINVTKGLLQPTTMP